MTLADLEAKVVRLRELHRARLAAEEEFSRSFDEMERNVQAWRRAQELAISRAVGAEQQALRVRMGRELESIKAATRAAVGLDGEED